MPPIARTCAAALPLFAALLLSFPAAAQDEASCRRWSDPLELTGRVVKTLLMAPDAQGDTSPQPVTVLRLDTPLCFSATPDDPEEAAVPPLREFQVTAAQALTRQVADAARRALAVKVHARAMPAVNIHHVTPALLDLTSLQPDPQAASIADAWQLTSENGAPIAVLPLSQSPTMTRLVIACSGPADLALRIEDRNGRNPQQVSFDFGPLGGPLVPRERDGRIGADHYSNIVDRYEDYAGMIGGEDSTALIEVGIHAETDNAQAVYNLHGMSRVRRDLRARCKDIAGSASAPVLASQAAARARSPMAVDMVRYCQRWVYGKACGCIVDDMIQGAARSPLGLPNQSDTMFKLWQGYQEARFNGGLSVMMSTQMPRYAQQLGVPAEKADAFVVETFTAIKAAAARCKG